MEKKDKNSLLNIHYSRTLTPDNLSKAANYVGEYVLKGLGTLGRFLNAGFTSPTYGTTGQVSYARNVKDAKRLRELSEASEQAVGKAMTWISPLNYGTALATGNGLDAKKGEEEVASWSPAWLAVGRLGELYVGPKAVKGVRKGVKAAPKAIVNTAAKARVKPAKAYLISKELNKGIKQNTKNGRIEVTGNYFNSPDKWYRVSERPEKIGIELNGKNVTTSDDPGINGTINGWRESILSLTGRVIPGKGVNEGYFIFLPRKISLSKHGAAHGNTSQAAKGLIWLGTFAFSDKFPIGVIEGLAPVRIFRGMNELGKDSRTNFVLLNWENVPLGARVGFHTGEMPMSNLGWFQKTNRGTYTYEPIISEKRISYQPKLLLDSSTSLKFFERKPSKISEAERAGVPKGERFKNKKHYTGIGRNYRETLFGEENIPKDIEYVEPITSGKKFGESDYSFENRKYATKQYLKELNNRDSGIFSDKGIESIKEYISLLSDDINPNFINTNDLLSFYIRDFRLYLNDLGYKAGDLTDTEIAKLLTNLYNILSKNLTGKLKGKVVFHSGPNFFDLFDFTHTGETMGNMGYLGPGNYFSTKPSIYGGKGNYTTQNLIGQYRYPRRLPYLINNIKSTPVSGELKRAEIIPEYTSPPRETYGDVSAKNNYILLVILPLVKSTKVRNIAVLDDISVSPHSLYTNGVQTEFMVPRNTGIKSLYPHPSLFIRDANGKIILNRNWDDIRVNYKQGGKMNILEFLKNGSGIHIKKKNRGKFTSYCGGKVTDECIRKAKASGNPTLVKRATFAANARKWKHEDGGIFKAADGTKTNTWLKIGNALNSGWGQLAINIGSSYLLNKALNKLIDYNQEMSDASLDMEKNELKKLIPHQALYMAEQILGTINPENPNEKGGVFAEVVPARLRMLLDGLLEQEYNNKKSLNKAQALLLKDLNTTNFIFGIGLNLGSILLNIDFSKKSSTNSTNIVQPVANNFSAGYNQFTQKPDYSNMLLR